jgi:hypothetical protein
MSRVNAPDMAELIKRADLGDRLALARCYGSAAAWLGAGKAPPAPLGEWLAGRIADLASIMADPRRKDAARIRADALRVMRVQRKVKGGPRPSRSAMLINKGLAEDVLHFIRTQRLSEAAACRQVAEYHSRPGTRRTAARSVKTVEAAWQVHREGLLQT